MPSTIQMALSAGYHEDLGGLVQDYLSKSVSTIDADTSILKPAQLFIDSPCRRYPVLQNGRLVGQISRLDVLRALESIG